MAPPPKYPVHLTYAERTQLHAYLAKGVGPRRSVLRIQILLQADATSASDAEIAARLQTSHDTVYRIRKRYTERGVEAAITERTRSGAPRRLDGPLEQYVTTLACSDPPTGHSAWTMQLLADRLVELGLVERISDETVRRTLKKMQPSPGCSNAG